MEQNLGKTVGKTERGPSEAAKQNAIEAISQLSAQYEKVKSDIKLAQIEPESNEKDDKLAALYGTQRILKDRLEAMGAKPETLQ